ncbi:glycosyltransferase family 4 protein [Candidatus Latescibacterota bacterium]
MPDSIKPKRILVLLIGEVLEDPRVYKTCISLSENGSDVTVACTNPSMRKKTETHSNLSIVRFPHPKEFIIKRLFGFLQGKLHRSVGRILSEVHEGVSTSSVKTVLRNYVLNLNAAHYMNSSLKINRMMAKAFADDSFDLVHCNDVNTLSAGCALRNSGAAEEMLYDSHEYWTGMGIVGSISNAMLREAEEDGIRSADYVVTVNPMIAGLLQEQYGLSRVPSVVMNCPYRYDGEVRADEIHSPARIIFQGKMQAYRGLEKLILAFKHIEGGVLTMSGYGPLAERLEALARIEKLSDKVMFTGRYNPKESTAILSGHDIGIITFEGMIPNNMYSSPNKLFEYAMSGLAIAASDLPFLAGVIKKNEMGELFGEITPESIAETLNGMIADTERLKKFKINARAAGVEKFSWKDQFLKNYPWKPEE